MPVVNGRQGNHSHGRTLVTPVIKATVPMLEVTKAVSVRRFARKVFDTFVRLEINEEYVARLKEKSLVSIFSQIRPERI
jgi:hypothetical protein